jgi:hypothetical protein
MNSNEINKPIRFRTVFLFGIIGIVILLIGFIFQNSTFHAFAGLYLLYLGAIVNYFYFKIDTLDTGIVFFVIGIAFIIIFIFLLLIWKIDPLTSLIEIIIIVLYAIGFLFFGRTMLKNWNQKRIIKQKND